MAKPYDAAMKDLVEEYPSDWLVQLDLASEDRVVDVIDADLSTVTAQADKVLRIQEAFTWLLHLEFQASRDRELSRRVLQYHVLLYARHRLPVQSVTVLLRPAADDPNLSGMVSYQPVSGRGSLEFRFQVVRIWQQPVESILTGGLGTLPLAPLSSGAETALPTVVRRMEERLTREVSSPSAAKLWAATYILMGLRYSPEVADQLLQGVQAMKESTTYQAILAEGLAEGMVKGKIEEARSILLRMGTKRFGSPESRIRTVIEEIADIKRLEHLMERLLDVASWDELLATP